MLFQDDSFDRPVRVLGEFAGDQNVASRRSIANPGYVFGFANRVGWCLSWTENRCLSSEAGR
jgi:hypothetical protein